jgi:hypothetical protein
LSTLHLYKHLHPFFSRLGHWCFSAFLKPSTYWSSSSKFFRISDDKHFLTLNILNRNFIYTTAIYLLIIIMI